MTLNNNKEKKLNLYTTIAFVIANMIGTGVFTSLGYQLTGISNFIAILVLWAIGGVIALCGSLVYSELGAAMPRSGGEYHYLSKIYHPYVGFLSGWVSITVGFAAPVAAACMALGSYTSGVFPVIPSQFIAVVVLILITLVHSYDIKFGGNFQNIFTLFKLVLIVVFIICGFVLTPKMQDLAPHIKSFSFKDLLNPSVAVSLVFVTYAFSGWNASAYIASEIKEPQRTIPKSLFISTLIVTVLYFLLNYSFLSTTPASEMVGKKEVGLISAIHIFGTVGGNIMGLLISFLLISTISSMIFVGPRVSQVMGEDLKLLNFLSKKSNKHHTPMNAIFLQSAISLVLILTSSFDSVITYAGFTLSFFTFLTVLGVFVHRYKYKDAERPYKTFGYPFVPILFLLIILWVLVFTYISKPFESNLGVITVLSGTIIYYWNYKYEKKINEKLYNSLN
jgi:basic amino acid/polyamine antiporter, APA family